ncbi:MAG: hypothetical protein N3E45_05770 [Oscillatoriaceae bacterium SKW80]|nr:hypothetical protein [Oscillatoriaceae bacterium SKYG93]MCX8120321.1 hypothetical protein [Oscillatoriaceae bacterium SKW80]MDW8453247.1 hypothetical protein [Oscillatoriaceae cyanobacterium SKYGB_i_bin93]
MRECGQIQESLSLATDMVILSQAERSFMSQQFPVPKLTSDGL